jgi:hypothetical protein
MGKPSPFGPLGSEEPIKGDKNRYPVKATKEALRLVNKANALMYSPVQRKAIYSRHRNSLDRERAKADERVWHIDGMDMSRYEVMEYVVIMVSEGEDKVKLCKQEGWPTLVLLDQWERRHPDFKIALQNAERLRGDQMDSEAIDAVQNVTPATVGVAKVKGELLNKAAARRNPKHQDKQVIETFDATEHMSREQMVDKLRALEERCPGLKKLSMKKLEPVTVDIEPEVETQSQDGEVDG